MKKKIFCLTLSALRLRGRAAGKEAPSDRFSSWWLPGGLAAQIIGEDQHFDGI
jgi:hypothetical protein